MSLFYVTVHSVASTTPADLVRFFKPSQFTALSAVKHSYLYRATDLYGASNQSRQNLFGDSCLTSSQRRSDPLAAARGCDQSSIGKTTRKLSTICPGTLTYVRTTRCGSFTF
jgi:hypothetical protein